MTKIHSKDLPRQISA